MLLSDSHPLPFLVKFPVPDNTPDKVNCPPVLTWKVFVLFRKMLLTKVIKELLLSIKVSSDKKKPLRVGLKSV